MAKAAGAAGAATDWAGNCPETIDQSARAALITSTGCLERAGTAEAGLVEKRHVHDQRYICGVEIADAGLIGSPAGLDGTTLTYCNSITAPTYTE